MVGSSTCGCDRHGCTWSLLLLVHNTCARVCFQALKNNPGGAPKELKVNSNYLTRFGQVALTEALDMVYEMGGGREIVITY